jgi:hypothetical protein
MKDIAVVILNWNGEHFLKKYLHKIVTDTTDEITEIVIIDNNSTDNSVKFISDHFPEIKIIKLDKNHGFAGGYNRGLLELRHKYFILLNSDIETTAKWHRILYDLMENDLSIGVCGPKLLQIEDKTKFEYSGAAGGFIDKNGYPFCRGRVFGTCEIDDGQYDSQINCFWVSGAALMIRSELFHKLNGFDERFFAHQEEIDLCWRIQNIGYKIVCEPKSKIYHLGGGTLNKTNPTKTYLNYRNNLYLIEKNMPKFKRNFVKFVRLFYDSFAAFQFLFQAKPKHSLAIVKAYFHFWINANKMAKNRKIIKPKAMKYLDGFVNKNIIWKYFLKRKKTYSEIIKTKTNKFC